MSIYDYINRDEKKINKAGIKVIILYVIVTWLILSNLIVSPKKNYFATAVIFLSILSVFFIGLSCYVFILPKISYTKTRKGITLEDEIFWNNGKVYEDIGIVLGKDELMIVKPTKKFSNNFILRIKYKDIEKIKFAWDLHNNNKSIFFGNTIYYYIFIKKFNNNKAIKVFFTYIGLTFNRVPNNKAYISDIAEDFIDDARARIKNCQ